MSDITTTWALPPAPSPQEVGRRSEEPLPRTSPVEFKATSEGLLRRVGNWYPLSTFEISADKCMMHQMPIGRAPEPPRVAVDRAARAGFGTAGFFAVASAVGPPSPCVDTNGPGRMAWRATARGCCGE